MRLLAFASLIASLLLIATSASNAEDSNPAETMWALFAKQCGHYLEAETIKETKAAFLPHQLELFATTDGSIQGGNGVIKGIAGSGDTHTLVNVFKTSIDGGTIYTCSYNSLSSGSTFKDLHSVVQTNAADLLGDDFNVNGGYGVGAKKAEGIVLLLSTPEFPPEKTINLTQSPRHVSLVLSATVKD